MGVPCSVQATFDARVTVSMPTVRAATRPTIWTPRYDLKFSISIDVMTRRRSPAPWSPETGVADVAISSSGDCAVVSRASFRVPRGKPPLIPRLDGRSGIEGAGGNRASATTSEKVGPRVTPFLSTSGVLRRDSGTSSWNCGAPSLPERPLDAGLPRQKPLCSRRRQPERVLASLPGPPEVLTPDSYHATVWGAQ